MRWQPSATLETIKRRAQLLAELRSFFHARGVLEVDVPVLGPATVTDPNLEPLEVLSNPATYLQTSPEFFMKRLLAAGSGSVFYLGKAFRAEEKGRRHRAEFTMLEWYRTGFDDTRLIAEVTELFLMLSPGLEVAAIPYRELFEAHVGIDPHSATAEKLAAIAREKLDIHWRDKNINTWLDLLFTHLVEPAIASDRLTIVTDYPASQCALAKVAHNALGQRVAKRFEVYWKGMELANGYWELTDVEEQKRRFASDNLIRQASGKKSVLVDALFLEALEHGLPECSGIALGVDRLLMCLLDKTDIEDVLYF